MSCSNLYRTVQMGIIAASSVIGAFALMSIHYIKWKSSVAPEVENDFNPGIRMIGQNRFNPSIFRTNVFFIVYWYCLLFTLLIMVVIYKVDFVPIFKEVLSPIGVKINLVAMYSLATMMYPFLIYLTHEEARRHLWRMTANIFVQQINAVSPS